MQFFREQGQTTAFSRWGAEQNPAVVLLMGLGLPGGCWPPVLIEHLVVQGFQVIVPDNRDAGASMHLSEEPVDQGDVLNGILNAVIGRNVTQAKYALTDMAVDVVRLLDYLALERVHVVGFSMGGMIAQVLAAHWPERVSTLTSISSASGHVRTGLGKFSAIWSLIREPKDGGFEDYFVRVVKKLAGPLYQPSEAELTFMKTCLSTETFDRQAMYRQLLAILASGDRSSELSLIEAPTLIIHGRNDPLLPLSAGQECARLIRGARLWSIEGMGHQLPVKLMPRFASQIATHCQGNL